MKDFRFDSEVHADFETKGSVDLRKCSAAVYARHEDTDVLCLATRPSDKNLSCLYTIDDIKDPERSKELRELAANPRVRWVAHNASFEYKIWKEIMVKRYGFPEIPLWRWKCTLAKCAACGLPQGLEQAAKALNLVSQKDMEGKKSMLALSKPRSKKDKDGNFVFYKFEDRPFDFITLFSYCCTDVATEYELDHYLPNLIPAEQEIWEQTERVNESGVRVNRPLIQKAIALGDAHKVHLKQRFSEIVGTDFGPSQRAEFKNWLAEQGLDVADTKKVTLEKAIQNNELEIDVEEAIELCGAANKSSLAKLPAMLRKSDEEGVLRDLLSYHSAHTGRWGGRGVQVQNLAKTVYDMAVLTGCVDAFNYELFAWAYQEIESALSSGIRGMIIPDPGTDMYVADLSQIEARLTAWLCGQEDSVEDFRRGMDPYLTAATKIYGWEITKKDKNERQVGKVSVLALGYAGGIAAYANMCSQYRIDLTPVLKPLWASATFEERKAAERSYIIYLKRHKDATTEPVPQMVGWVSDLIKQRWRDGNPKIVAFWAELERTAIEAVRSGKPVKCGRLTWFMHGIFLHCRLPSGRDIRYPFPKVEDTSRSSKLSYRTMNEKHQWVRESTYGGSLLENIIQGIGRDILVNALRLIEESERYRILFHVHDEGISQAKKGVGDLEEYIDFFRQPVKGLEGLPIDADGWVGSQYRKAA